MSYFIYTELISSLLDPKLVNPGSTLIHVGAYQPKSWNSQLPCLTFSIQRDSVKVGQQVRLCPWARHLTKSFDLCKILESPAVA